MNEKSVAFYANIVTELVARGGGVRLTLSNYWQFHPSIHQSIHPSIGPESPTFGVGVFSISNSPVFI